MARGVGRNITIRCITTAAMAAALLIAWAAAAGASSIDSLITASELPPGARLATGFPKTDLGDTPKYATLDDCAFGTETSSRPTTLYVAAFVDKDTGGTKLTGEDQVYDFPDAAAAEKFYDAGRAFYTGAPKCKKVTSSSGRKVTYRSVDVGDIGDERAAVGTSEPSGYASYSAQVLDGKSVVRVTLAGKVSRSDFQQLVKRAASRFEQAS